MRTTVYIAAPYGDPTPEGRARNAARARWLATVAHRMGLAPVYVHDAIEVGVFGDDADPEARAMGLEAACTLAASCERLWVARDGDDMSAGVLAEWEAWHTAHRCTTIGREWTWEQWRDQAGWDLGDRCPPWPG
jgi:hypothetical protein